MYACKSEVKEVAEMLIDIHAKNNDGMNALMFVRSYSSKGLPMLLIDRGCQIRDNAYNSMLECNNDHKSAKVIFAYLAIGVDTNKYYLKLSVDFLVKNAGILTESNNEGYGAHPFGVFNPEVRILKALLMQDELADSINEYNNKGFTALKLATTMQGREEHIKLLISHSASPSFLGKIR